MRGDGYHPYKNVPRKSVSFLTTFQMTGRKQIEPIYFNSWSASFIWLNLARVVYMQQPTFNKIKNLISAKRELNKKRPQTCSENIHQCKSILECHDLLKWDNFHWVEVLHCITNLLHLNLLWDFFFFFSHSYNLDL